MLNTTYVEIEPTKDYFFAVDGEIIRARRLKI